MTAPLTRGAVIAIGSELLTPLRVDTNSLAISEQLNAIGIEVAYKVVVGDDRAELAAALRMALQRVNLVVCSGGLGPTDDDVTRDVVADVLGCPLAEEQAITARIRARFAGRGMSMPDINRRQAMVPAGAHVLENGAGTAPGLWLDVGDRVVLLLPGPPRELKPMLAALVAGRLGARAGGNVIRRRVVRMTGRTESHTEEALQPLYAEWARRDVRIDATILAALGQIELHLSARTPTPAAADEALDRAALEVRSALGGDVYSIDGAPMERVVGALLADRGLRIALAESCTGGLLTSRLTDVPGSSRYVARGVVAYENSAKIALLGVPGVLIDAHGAVSEEVARSMAEGVRAGSGADIGVGVTGIAGPGGGSVEKPVGTVAIAVTSAASSVSRTFRFIGEREQVKFQATQAAMDIVRRMLLQP